MRFISNFGCKIIFMCSVNFWHQQDSNSLFKGSIGHVNSRNACALFLLSMGQFTTTSGYQNAS